MKRNIKRLSDLVRFIADIGSKTENLLVFRGEKKDHGETALVPLVYRDGYLKSEDIIYRESQRFNDHEFTSDIGVFDRLSRIQHYSAPTRLIDVSEDLLSSVYFAIDDKEVENDDDYAIVYIFEINRNHIKYYDSDTVAVVSNLAKLPLNNSNEKSKTSLLRESLGLRNDKEKFNETDSAKYLLHEIKHEKPQFENIIKPEHLTSIQFVLPKLTSSRVRSQKGAFLLFGLNPDNCEESIWLLRNGKFQKKIKNVNHPIIDIHTAILKGENIKIIQKELMSVGIKKTFIYPEIDKVSEYLKRLYKVQKLA